MLNEKQQRFVDEYLVDLNASAAARRAGYAEKRADAMGWENLRKPEIAAAIADAKQKRAKRTKIKSRRVIEELALAAFSDVGEILDFSGTEPRLKPPSQITEAARRSIASVKVRRYVKGKGDDARDVEVTEFRLWPKIDALKTLAQHFGLLKDKLELTGKDGKPIKIAVDPKTLTDDELDLAIRLAKRARAIVEPGGAGSREGPPLASEGTPTLPS